MINYTKTIVQDKPDYVEKKLLLITKSKDKLFRTNDGNYIEIEIDNTGDLFVYMVSEAMVKQKIEYSLRKIGEMFLGLSDPSVLQILNYFILPEMEVERIFNNLRYKYLQSLKFGNKIPDKYITSECNTLFKALAGLFIRGKGKKEDKIEKNLKKQCFNPRRKYIDLEEERKDLDFIIKYFRSNCFDNPNCKIKDKINLYKEIISIKPGFHEVFMDKKHGMEHKKGLENEEDDRIRTTTLKIIHGIYNDNCLNSKNLKIKELNYEFNCKNFLTYASCNITEGPFVFRKKISVSYFDEIRKIKTKDDLEKLDKKFHYLDYYNCNLDTLEKLNDFLLKAEKFRYFM